MGMVFQSFNLFPHKTALQNIMESLIIVDKMDKTKAKEKAIKLLKMVGLEDKANMYPRTLSGVQIGRAHV